MLRPNALIVDDSPALRGVLNDILARYGFTIREAENGKAAISNIENFGVPALMLVDWQMPVMDGLTLTRDLRTKPACQAMRIMMITGITDLDSIREALAAGVDEYLMKPYTHEALLDKLALLGFGPHVAAQE